MAEPFIGEIRCFSFNFAPDGWAPCDGRMLSIVQNQALFSILGTTYGGNGTTTFALPDLRGRAPVHNGNGVLLGQSAGEEVHTLTTNEMPAHVHTVSANSDGATSKMAAGNAWGNNGTNSYAPQPDGVMSPNALAAAGGGQSHPNMQPYNVANYCIALVGIYPTRN